MKLRYILLTVILLCAICIKAEPILKIENHTAEQNSQIIIPVTVKDFNNIISIQGTIEFNQNLISYVSTQDYGLPGLNNSSFGTTQVSSGELTFLWFESMLIGQNLADDAVLFSIKFNVTGDPGLISFLNFSNNPTELEMINGDLEYQIFQTVNGSIFIIPENNENNILLFADTISGETGSQVIMSVRVKNFSEISSVQGTMYFDPNIVSFANFASFGLPSMSAANFGIGLISEGKISFSWFDIIPEGTSMADSSSIFSLLFNLIGSPGQQSSISFGNNPAQIEFTNINSTVLDYSTIDGHIKITESLGIGNTEFRIDSVFGPQGSVVEIPIRGFDFSGIVAMQGSIQFDNTIAEFESLNYMGLPYMDISNFGLSQTENGKIMYSWSNPELNGVSVADSSVLFSFTVKLIGDPFTSTNIDFVNSPTGLECIDYNFNLISANYKSGKAEISGEAGIIINNPSNFEYCAGEEVIISYIANGVFIEGNNFILQLSDKNGEFDLAINLDTIISVNSATFSTFLPINIEEGTLYRLRIISTNPNVISSTTEEITIRELPPIPFVPTGDNIVCKASTNVEYQTQEIIGIISYNWQLSPIEAGILNSNNNSVNIDWDENFSGLAHLSLSASNSFCTGLLSSELEISVISIPETPEIPSGNFLICQGTISSEYTTSLVAEADNYIWTINPIEAGTITTIDNNAEISWNLSFTGLAFVTVMAQNQICDGGISEALEITILQYPDIPLIPSGPLELCINSANSVYTIESVPLATDYIWQINPPIAGLVISNGISAEIDWNNLFSGLVEISVKATNQICESEYSDILNVNILNPLPAPEVPTGPDNLCQNPDNTTYSISPVIGADYYIWGIHPPESGIISGNGSSVSINWNDIFTGTAYVYVSAANDICNGINSDSLMVIISTYPNSPEVENEVACFGTNIPNLNASGIGIINWYSDENLMNLVHSGQTFSTGNTDVGTYTYYVTQVVNNCESDAAEISLTIFDLPEAPISDGDILICENDEMLPISVTASGVIKWYNDEELQNLVYLGNPYLSNQTNPGIYNYYATQTDINHCESNAVAMTVSINNTPEKPDITNSQACEGSIIINPLSAEGNNIKWYDDEELSNIVHTGNIYDPELTENGYYYFFVTQSINDCESPAEIATLTIFQIPENPEVENEVACFGTNIPNLNASGIGIINWYSDENLMNLVHSGQTFSTGNTDVGTYTYYVTQTENDCESGASEINLTIHHTPVNPSQPFGENLICVDFTNQQYHTSIIPDVLEYHWILSPEASGNILVDNNTVIINWNSNYSGMAELSVYVSGEFCSSNPSEVLIIEISALPNQPAIPSGDALICQETVSSDFYITDSEYLIFDWNLIPQEAGIISGNTSSIEIFWNPEFSGLAQISAAAINICGVGIFSETLEIIISPTPNQPIITVNLPYLYSDYSDGNQWYYNGFLIENANDNILFVEQDGFYHVMYTDNNNCSSESEPVEVINVGVSSSKNQQSFIYPNPSSGILFVNSPMRPEQIIISDMYGRVIYCFESISNINYFELNNLAKGIYLINIHFSDKIEVLKVVLQ